MSTLARTLKPTAQFLAAALVAFIGLAVAATAVGHVIDPVHVGLWSGPSVFSFGTLDDTIRAHQLPGSTLYIVTVMVVVLCFLIARELVGFARKGLARQAP